MTDASVRGRFIWYDLMTTDPSGAVPFYGALITNCGFCVVAALSR